MFLILLSIRFNNIYTIHLFNCHCGSVSLDASKKCILCQWRWYINYHLWSQRVRLSLNNCLRQKSQKKVKLVDLLTSAFKKTKQKKNVTLDLIHMTVQLRRLSPIYMVYSNIMGCHIFHTAS